LGFQPFSNNLYFGKIIVSKFFGADFIEFFLAHVVFWGLLKFGNKKARIDFHYGLL